ncbi:MAG: phosphate regulon sensor histidine kinase PhoR [Gammaproteobacteria bacterium]|nr:phosphate regulon sensor histidine kinase PhoR [Gammaproteobacteria bacterium]MCW8986773.1 phosphate regulon sensor histidine kinase PhoR [Gammaproteobacteria bacterium]MCW9029883.1 phosphate regulon sensor histidine kinase PhoR [Gammaproteobacteria bacterium]
MSPQQQHEITTLLVLIATSAAIGALFNKSLLFVTIVLFIYIIFMLGNVFKLHDWLLEQKSELPDAQGYWGEIFNELHLLERKKNKQQKLLSVALSRFKKAAEALPDGVVILSQQNEIEWVNPIASSLLGIAYPRDAGQKINNLIRHPNFQRYLSKEKFSKTITIPSPDNAENILTIQIIPFGYKQKMIFCRDVTHIHKLEEMRTNFVSNVSHEMRSPLTVLTGYLEMFSDNIPKDEKSFKLGLENMYQQAMRMQRLVTDLLALSKMETAPIEHAKQVDVATLLITLKENAEVLGQHKKQTITLDADEDVKLRGNVHELHSLFANLINNAVRYTQENGSIKISWKKQGNEAVFSVSDNGPGIAAKHIPHLTERFYRADIDRSRESGGTGLGLAIVKYAAERHDGRLVISSSLGEGSTFKCYFPEQRISA